MDPPLYMTSSISTLLAPPTHIHSNPSATSFSVDREARILRDMERRSSKTAHGSNRTDRKTVERNRRIHMKALCLKLTSLIPPHYFNPSKELLSQQGQLDQAAAYIKQMKERVDKLKFKAQAMRGNKTNDGTKMIGMTQLPMIELRDLGSSIEVIVVSGLQKNFMLYEVISVIEEEGAEVVSASFSTVGDKAFHCIHAQVKISRVGIDISRVYQRLQEFIS